MQGDRSQAGEPFKNVLELAPRRGMDAQTRAGHIGLALADGDLQDLKRAVEIHDLVQHLRQDERVDDMSANVNDL